MLTLVGEIGPDYPVGDHITVDTTINLDPLVFTQAQPLTQAHDDTSGDQ